MDGSTRLYKWFYVKKTERETDGPLTIRGQSASEIKNFAFGRRKILTDHSDVPTMVIFSCEKQQRIWHLFLQILF